MKKMIFLTVAVSGVGGGQIHTRNKMNYCKTHGYKVYIISGHNDDIYIEDLKPFSNAVVGELEFFPGFFTNKKREKIISEILKICEFVDGDELIFECQGLTHACWGELAAKACNGKSIAYLLGERFGKKSVINLEDFLEFKYKRRELATIGNSKVMQNLFAPFRKLSVDECFTLKAASWNEAEDVEIPKYIMLGERCDKTIGILGRFDKPFVSVALDTLSELSRKYNDISFKVIMMGNLSQKNISHKIKNLNKLSNVQVVVTGYIYPVPKKLLKMCDVCISSSGAAGVCGREVLTISIDAYTDRAIGILGYDTKATLVSDNPDAKSLIQYLQMVLFTDFKEEANYTLLPPLDKKECLGRIENQFAFIDQSEQTKDYFSFNYNSKNLTDRIYRVVSSIGGVKVLKLLRDIKRTISCKVKKHSGGGNNSLTTKILLPHLSGSGYNYA